MRCTAQDNRFPASYDLLVKSGPGVTFDQFQRLLTWHRTAVGALTGQGFVDVDDGANFCPGMNLVFVGTGRIASPVVPFVVLIDHHQLAVAKIASPGELAKSGRRVQLDDAKFLIVQLSR